MNQFTIRIGTTQICFNNETDTSVLDSAEKNGLVLQAHCRIGVCGACRIKMVAGSVNYKVEPLAYIEENEILPCCCIPSDNMTVIK